MITTWLLSSCTAAYLWVRLRARVNASDLLMCDGFAAVCEGSARLPTS
jgi:hypothetical protein